MSVPEPMNISPPSPRRRPLDDLPRIVRGDRQIVAAAGVVPARRNSIKTLQVQGDLIALDQKDAFMLRASLWEAKAA